MMKVILSIPYGNMYSEVRKEMGNAFYLVYGMILKYEV